MNCDCPFLQPSKRDTAIDKITVCLEDSVGREQAYADGVDRGELLVELAVSKHPWVEHDVDFVAAATIEFLACALDMLRVNQEVVLHSTLCTDFGNHLLGQVKARCLDPRQRRRQRQGDGREERDVIFRGVDTKVRVFVSES